MSLSLFIDIKFRINGLTYLTLAVQMESAFYVIGFRVVLSPSSNKKDVFIELGSYYGSHRLHFYQFFIFIQRHQ